MKKNGEQRKNTHIFFVILSIVLIVNGFEIAFGVVMAIQWEIQLKSHGKNIALYENKNTTDTEREEKEGGGLLEEERKMRWTTKSVLDIKMRGS